MIGAARAINKMMPMTIIETDCQFVAQEAL